MSFCTAYKRTFDDLKAPVTSSNEFRRRPGITNSALT
jgi:hypothetical protein